MKTSIHYICLFIATLMLFSCKEDDELPILVELPSEAYQFIGKHFHGFDILSAEDTESTPKYIVTLEGGITITFDEQGWWDSVETETELPASIIEMINEATLSQLAIKEPGQKIRKIYNYIFGGGAEHVFQLSNGTVYIDCFGLQYDNGLGVMPTFERLPEPIQDFMNRNKLNTLPYNAIYLKTETEEFYRIDFGRSSCIVFDQDFKLIFIQDYSDELLAKMINITVREVPPVIASKIVDLCKGKKELKSVYSYRDGYYGILLTDNEINLERNVSYLIKPSGEIVNPPVERANELATTYFGAKENIRMSISLGYYSYSYHFTYRYEGDYFTLHMFMGDGDWTSVYSEVRGILKKEIPEAFIKDMLPAKINEYLKENPDKKICLIGRDEERYTLLTDESVLIRFDKEGNLINQ